jgi:hypothetical protein
MIAVHVHRTALVAASLQRSRYSSDIPHCFFDDPRADHSVLNGSNKAARKASSKPPERLFRVWHMWKMSSAHFAHFQTPCVTQRYVLGVLAGYLTELLIQKNDLPTT